MSESSSPRTTPDAPAPSAPSAPPLPSALPVPPVPSAPPGPTTDLASQIATATVATAGVARLVPGLKSALLRLRRAAAEADADGVTVVADGDGLRVVIDIGVRPEAVVIDTARAVRAAAQDVVGSALGGPFVVRVNVLAWEPEPSAPAEPSQDQRVR